MQAGHQPAPADYLGDTAMDEMKYLFQSCFNVKKYRISDDLILIN